MPFSMSSNDIRSPSRLHLAFTAFALVMCSLAALPATAAARGLDAAGRGAVLAHDLNRNTMQQASAVARQAQAQGIRINDVFDYLHKTKSMLQLTSALNQQGGMSAILAQQGMDARSFLLTVLAARQVALQAGTEADLTAKLLGLPSDANKAYFQSHRQDVLDLLSLCNGEAQSVHGNPVDSTPPASESDIKIDCTGMALALDPVEYTFTHAVTASHGPTPVPEGTFTRIAKSYATMAGNMDAPTPKAALTTMANEVKAQEGASPAQITHAYRAAQASLTAWLRTHCQ